MTAWSATECTAQAPSVRDSAGVTVSTTQPRLGAGGAAWALSDEPILMIGMLDGPEAYLFSSVWDALRTPAGQLVVVDRDSYDIRVFSPDGQHMASFGRRGDGPEEFGGPPWIALAPPDTLVVWDPGHFRLSRYGLDGELISQASRSSQFDSLGVRRFPNGLVWQTGSDGSLLSTAQTEVAVHEGRVDHSRRFLLLHGEGATSHDFGPRVSGQTFYVRRDAAGLSGFGNPLGAHAAVALDNRGDRVAISDAERWEVRVFDRDGTMRNLFRGSFPREPISRSMVARARDGAVGGASRMGVTRRQAETAFDALPMADSLPAIARLIWDAAGNLWVGRQAGTVADVNQYDVLDGDGTWLASVRLPDGLGRIFEIGHDYILATGNDQFDVQYLRLFGLEKADR